MSVRSREWEDEDRASMGPMVSTGSFYQSGSEGGVEQHLKAREQASGSGHQCSGVESSDGPASTVDSDVPRVIPWHFSISLAFPVNVGDKGKCTSLIEKRKKCPKTGKPAAKLRRFYHIEYFLLPHDGEPKKVDIVLFPAVAKVFLDSEVKTVRPWHEGDKVWVSWTQTFNINMTKELLKKINFHRITLRLWDTKEKILKKIRKYRSETFGFSEDAGALEEVRDVLLRQRRLFEQGRHKEKWNEESLHAGPEAFSKNAEGFPKLVRTEDLATVGWSTSRAQGISFGGEKEMERKELTERSSFSSLPNILEKLTFQVKQEKSEGRKKSQKGRNKSQAEEETDPMLAGHGKQCTFSIQLVLTPLLAGCETVVSRGSGMSANILDCLLTLKTEVPLMTEEQKRDLNPLTIKIKCVSCLPSQPLPIHELERLCTPVYCKYQFHKTPVHKTEGQPHGVRIYFEDINVIFLGLMHPSDLREYLEGPPMVVEVHDRDRKSEEYSQKPTLFGEDPLDSYLNFQALFSPKETESQNKMWDPYGVAHVSFADLLLGHKFLNLAVPIQNCKPKPADCGPDSRSRKVVGFRVPTDGLQRGPMPMGNYLEANSTLKLRVDIAVPLQAGAEAPNPDLTGTRFGRMIFMFGSREILLHSLLQDITMINAKALDLDSYPIENIQQILSGFKMWVKIQEREDLDVLTGFHLLDGKIHLLVLEGLADQGLKCLWERHESQISELDHGKCKVLYNSQLLFRHRLYADLETILYRVHLSETLSWLMKQPSLYIHDAVPWDAFQALSRIHWICYYSTSLREVITGDLLPSSDMIKALSQEFGLPVSWEQLRGAKLLAMPPHPAPNLEDLQSWGSTLPNEIRAHQEKYPQWQNTRLLKKRGQKHSLIQERREDAPAANALKPGLDRERWSWDRRHQDFDLCRKPPPLPKLLPSLSPKPVTGNR
ncbi:uncharacterized protein FLJ43738-like [Diceros bicornis minor]|uniref:uncharacterized protein FLJ43738-like n=1 Tax=Diceros bicornis minor TaxID=77932 RepID=UPI0026F18D7A|nr:uncharacterized protein FLJ43738-like [Diceros bicornis minor]